MSEAGLWIYRSNRLEVLVELLAWLAGQPERMPADPMQPVAIAVANVGMARWLEHRLAERWGVLAHVDLIFPAKAFDSGVREVLQEPPRDEHPDPWSPEVLRWTLLELLGEIEHDPDPVYAPLRDYLAADPQREHVAPGVATARTYALAHQLADLMDRYVIYRPDWARAWTAGKPSGANVPPVAQAWQPALMRRVAELHGDDHAAGRAQRLAARLDAGPSPGSQEPLRLFGLSSLPPAMLHTAALLARRRPIELYLLCPSNVYWADLHQRRDRLRSWSTLDRDALGEALREDHAEPANALLAAFGRVMRDFQIALEHLPEESVRDCRDVFVDLARAQGEAAPRNPDFPDPAAGGPSALARLQSDVLHAHAGAPSTLGPNDHSLQFHACHGRIRQVEVLRDVLLGLFAENRDLEPRDVVIMCPDIENFAPLIGAVFEGGRHKPEEGHGEHHRWGPSGAPHIPYAVADLSLRRSNPVADALLRLLSLSESRFSAADLLELVGLDPIQRRFEIRPEDLPTLRRWVVESGMRWAADAADRGDHGQPGDVLNTLQFGLDRLLVGVCLRDNGRDQWAGVGPFDRHVASDTPLLGRFAALVSRLVRMREELRQPRSLADWLKLILGAAPGESAPGAPGDGPVPGLLDDFTATTESGAWLRWKLDEALSELGRGAEAAQQTRPLDVAGLRTALAGRFDHSGDSSPRESGGVTFSSLVPMRGLPHRVVGLLGMDEEVFPRRSPRFAFDLSSHPARLGDGDASADDRGALLEALLAARSHFLVFYAGRDVRSNERCAPAVPVGELRDAIDQTFHCPGETPASQALTREHPLQAFSPQNFGLHGPATSYDPRLAEAAQRSQARDPRRRHPFYVRGSALPAPAPSSPPPPLPRVVPLEEMARFLRKPHRELLRARFGLIEYEDELDQVPHREPLEIAGGLELWGIRQAFLEAQLNGEPEARIAERLRLEGRLPLGSGGDIALAQPRRISRVLSDALSQLPGPPDGRVRIQHRLGDHVLTGEVGGLRGPIEVVLRSTQDNPANAPSYLLEPWLRLLARQLVAPDPDAAIWVLHFKPKAPNLQYRTFRLASESPAAEAESALRALLALYDEARQRPLPILKHGGHAFAWTLRTELTGAETRTAEDWSVALRAMPSAQIANVEKAVRGSWKKDFGGRGDADDPAILRLFGEETPAFTDTGAFAPDFARAAVTIWGPLTQGRKAHRKAPPFPTGETP